MPLDRPTLEELLERDRDDLASRLSLTIAVIRRRVADAVAHVQAAMVHGLYGQIDFLSLQLFVVTAEEEFLLRIAAQYGLSPNPATNATGNASFTGTIGEAVPASSVLRRDDAVEYVVTVGGNIGAGGSLDTTVTAVLAGSAGNLDTGETLEFVSTPPGVNTVALVATEPNGGPLEGGNDQETIEALRQRLLERLREPPAGGRDADYVAWAKLVTGVTRVWVFRHELGLGTVVVRFVRDNDEPTIIPDAGEVTAVAASIGEFRPTTAEVTVLAPVDVPLLYTLTIVPDAPENRTAIEGALDDLHFRDAEAGDGLGRGTIFLSQVYTSVGTAAALDDFTVTAPLGDSVPALGELLTRGTITWLP